MEITNKNIFREIVAGCTTFFTMAYIMAVNPMILAPTGMDPGALFVATCLAAAFGCFLMGTLANYPIALAPTLGINTYFAFVVTNNHFFTWQLALGAVLLAGLLFAILTFTGVRRWLIYNMPETLKIAISVGIGLFLVVIALKNLNIFYLPNDRIFPQVHWQNFLSSNSYLCLAGLLLMMLLTKLRVIGAILLGLFAITFTGIYLGLTPSFQGIIATPPDLSPIFFKLQIPSLLSLNTFEVVLTFLFVSLLDNTGTTIAVLQQGSLLENKAYQSRLGKALFADSLACMGSAFLGTSPTGSYLESIAAVRAGGKTGLVAITVGILFLAALFFSPLFKIIPNFAGAAALLFVAFFMLRSLVLLPWHDLTETVPALITFITIPLTCSIADGLCAAFISYILIKCLFGRFKDLNLGLWCLAGFSGLYVLFHVFQAVG